MRVSANESREQAPRTSKRTILLVEDNKINQKLGAKMLKMLKYDVLLAEDGQEAVDIVMKYSRTIDAILMDQSMPRKDGITATREIRGLEAVGRLVGRQTIIAVTAAAGPEAQAQFLEAGTDIFLSKPLSLAKLEQTLSVCFGG
jgi:CheY-like chemotaxis protein